MTAAQTKKYFPGSNTADGYRGFLPELQKNAKRTVILKGGPGVGKSTWMADTGKHFEQRGNSVRYYYCSGDPDSLDAVFIPETGYLLLDGTAPHIIDPICPGARDGIVNLGVCLDEKQLSRQAEEISRLQWAIADDYAQATRYLNAARTLRLDAAVVYSAALTEQSRRQMLQAAMGRLPDGPEGEGSHTFAQAVTCKGVVSCWDSMEADSILCIDAPWGFDMHFLLHTLAEAAAARSICHTCWHDPVDAGRLAHLTVGSHLITTARMEQAEELTPVFDAGILRRENQRLSFDRAVYNLTLNQAIEALAQAKERHDTLERYYIDAMNYDQLNEMKQAFFNSLP